MFALPQFTAVLSKKCSVRPSSTLFAEQNVYVWDVQRRGRAIKAEKERKKRLAIEAALASRANSSLTIC